ncbi:immune inhibitor A domain-containing protein [Nocardioides speluncae]|uniref:immune inhibitor A domain-containing protein n=1 Tax=Nocardioides speluncae TaxID=2670337 RepID=UPI000D69D17F|nr:immune inhibitor A domain-containing protein [Nocardioides speluncae]
MKTSRLARNRLRAAVAVPALALVAAGLASTGASGGTTAKPDPAPADKAASAAGDDYYINYVAPRAEKAFDVDVRLSKNGAKNKAILKDALDEAAAYDAKHAAGNPKAARQLARTEAKAIRTGLSPQELNSKAAGKKKGPQVAKLLTILVEFNEAANDDFSGTQVPEFWGSEGCKPGAASLNGPLHNELPDPADFDQKDNNSMWVPDFSPRHFDKMLFTKKGITERVRKDLRGPDGRRGIDISGYTMKNMFEEMSKGAYTVSGKTTPWVEVPHSEAWYGATTCFQDEEGNWTYGAVQDMQGHPDNDLGPGQLPIDAVAALAEAEPDFPWADYDVEDQGDVDGDGNLLEPDGVIDHVVLVHAGADKSSGGGAEGTYSIWAHSSAVAGGAPIPGTDLRLSNYIVQPEDSGVGVFAHEYGHDLGLPDLYDTSGAGDSDVDFWDLMSSGSHSGPIFQSMPTHMGLWDKWVLGWADPLEIEPGDDVQTAVVGQTSRPPAGTEDGLKVNLPEKVISLAEPHSGANMWYSSADQDWADVKLSRTVEVPDAADAKFWMWNNYVIEADWDYGFVEVSTDGGTTWTEQKVYDETGTLVSTDDDYPDPNGRLADYGGKKYGLTGDTHGWRHDYVDLSGFAGQTIQLRLRQATDAGFLERGWFGDDFSVTGGGATTWTDDVEGADNNGWTQTGGTWTNTSGAGWVKHSGTEVKQQYYLVEWRNYNGFDKGLQYAYDTTYSETGAPATNGAWKVEKIKYNAPGMLVWYRDTTFGNVNHVANNAQSTVLPSAGAKGGLLIVDSHFDPLRRSGANAALDPTTLKNLPSRPQSSNAAFGLVDTKRFKECQPKPDFTEECNTFDPQAPVKTFRDTRTWYPGIEIRGTSLFFRDIDASTVVPSRGNEQYSTRVVDADGTPLPEFYGTDIGIGILGTGNPSDDGVAFNTVIWVVKALQGNKAARISVVPPTP